MSEENIKNNIVDKIEAEKEILETMPKNNAKNLNKYKKKVNELENEYEEYRKQILEIFKERYENYIDVAKNEKIDGFEDKLAEIKKSLPLLNDDRDYDEKLSLDRNIYKIGKFYKENLDSINLQIADYINKFSNLGIEIIPSDFDYNEYVKQYMEIFLGELANNNVKSKALKTKFEEIYWKCPDIIIYIELNLRDIYDKNKTEIEKIVDERKKELLSKIDNQPSKLMKQYLELKQEQIELTSTDKKILIDGLLSKKEDFRNFTEDKFDNNCNKIVPKAMIAGIKENSSEFEQNIFKFLHSIYEYRDYMKFKFIVDDIIKIYQAKEENEKKYQDTKKQIEELSKELKKVNESAQAKHSFFKRKKVKDIKMEQNKLILDLKNLYKEYDVLKINDKIYKKLQDDSTIYDVLKLAQSTYIYLVNCIIKYHQDITPEGIDDMVLELEEFLESPYNTIINHLTILDKKDIALMIKDRYKLFNFLIERPDLDEDNLDKLISTLELLNKSFYYKNVDIDMEDIKNLIQIKKILNLD